jgi:hypothetical protein
MFISNWWIIQLCWRRWRERRTWSQQNIPELCQSFSRFRWFFSFLLESSWRSDSINLSAISWSLWKLRHCAARSSIKFSLIPGSGAGWKASTEFIGIGQRWYPAMIPWLNQRHLRHSWFNAIWCSFVLVMTFPISARFCSEFENSSPRVCVSNTPVSFRSFSAFGTI